MASLFVLAVILFSCFQLGFSAPSQAHMLITAPPNPAPTRCANNLLRRTESCQYGACGSLCLSQGAFCCGPAGTKALAPLWICDNGACVTSVKGTTGVVDCYDPDNPSATTQSCIDNVPTATCRSTDRCYTCSSDFPYCQWESYIAEGSPTLRWFSCVETKVSDLTFLAATITGSLGNAESTISTSASATSTSGSSSDSPPLATGTIIGVSAAGGTVLLIILGVTVWYCMKRRKSANGTSSRPAEMSAPQTVYYPPPAELDNSHPPMYHSGQSEVGSSHGQSPSHTFSPYTTYDTRYTRSGSEPDIWTQRTPSVPTAELPGKPSVAYHTVAEIDTRNSYIEGDDMEHMSRRRIDK